MDHTVPPVKSIANWSPARPPVTGPARIAIRPGMVIRSENAKNQFRFPMMSYTGARLTPERTSHRAGEELVLGDAVEARLACPRLGEHEAEQRPRHRDRGEHRDEDAD